MRDAPIDAIPIDHLTGAVAVTSLEVEARRSRKTVAAEPACFATDFTHLADHCALPQNAGCCFDVRTAGDYIRVRADSAADAEHWLRMINLYCARRQPEAHGAVSAAALEAVAEESGRTTRRIRQIRPPTVRAFLERHLSGERHAQVASDQPPTYRLSL